MKTKDLVIMAMLTGVIFAAQVAMASLPNIEVVTLLVILYTQLYRKKVFFILYSFIVLEGLFYGFGLWWFNYLYIWPLLALLVLLLGKTSHSPVFWSIVAGAYGLCFGMLCAIPYFISGGIGGGLAYWISGIPYDILHCAGNTVLCLLLYRPLYQVMTQMLKAGIVRT
ncbi:MAG: hypothetical protein MSA90_22340 [Faecalicatena sp.]|uniref:hypothetical protein n=1 Tax=Faecalicatena sp. TaxID=2005360 RepID=UPI0025847CFE|nr:hypothetical protein [Faecalicatena sp.]MCI6468190.1 hypothetical protein [Faecalicatena sp.]MDY5620445.1 hypothetical protein [Lachnospiraceae bacterium]